MTQIDKYGLATTVDTTAHFSSLKSVNERLENLKIKLQQNCGCDTKYPTTAIKMDTTSALPQNRPDNRTQ